MTLTDLFKGHRQLLIKHFMMEPKQEWQCEGCSLAMDHINGLLPHFEHHDLSYVAVSRAPIEEIEVVRKRMGWKFCWVSSYKSDFNYDFHVSFRPDEVKAGKTIYNFREKKIGPETYTLSGHSVFYKNAKGEIFHTYGAFGRGDEQFMESSVSLTYCLRDARSMDRRTRFQTGRRFTTSMKTMARLTVAGGRTYEKGSASALDIRS